jgi:1-acyl-sn-glycerol-3-phosphate acyltransferase
VILISLFPQVDCVVKEAVIRNPFMRGLVGPANYISNREPADLLDSCVAHLLAGDSLLLFPEGTRTVRGQAPALKLGAAEIAVRAQAVVLPVVIDCHPQFLTKTDPWYWIPEKQPLFRLKLMPPVAAQTLVNRHPGDEADRYRFNQSLAEIFVPDSVGV